MPTACTASNNAASSPGCPTAAIQFADSVISLKLGDRRGGKIGNRLANRHARRIARCCSNATGARSAIAIASPA